MYKNLATCSQQISRRKHKNFENHPKTFRIPRKWKMKIRPTAINVFINQLSNLRIVEITWCIRKIFRMNQQGLGCVSHELHDRHCWAFPRPMQRSWIASLRVWSIIRCIRWRKCVPPTRLANYSGFDNGESVFHQNLIKLPFPRIIQPNRTIPCREILDNQRCPTCIA